MDKFNRQYRVTIDMGDGSEPIIITKPLTVQFSVQRNVMAQLNYFSISIYNLSSALRERIFQDWFDVQKRVKRTIKFEAGYDSLTEIFKGSIFQASSRRDGTEIITDIESNDGFYEVSLTQIFETYNSGGTIRDLLLFLIGRLSPLEVGAVGTFDTPITNPIVLNGSVYQLIRKYSNGNCYIDNEKVYCLDVNEVVTAEVPVIGAGSGLLDTPVRSEGFLTVNTLLETRIGIGLIAELKSAILPVYNGQYKVVGLMHRGIISDAVGGQAISTFNLLTGAKTFGAFKEVASAD